MKRRTKTRGVNSRNVVARGWRAKYDKKAQVQKVQQEKREDLISNYEPTLDGLTRGIKVARDAGGNSMSVMYATCFLVDHSSQYENSDELYEKLYDTAQKYADMKMRGELQPTLLEQEFIQKNMNFRNVRSRSQRDADLVEYFCKRELATIM